ncbi:hypothetical protein L7F22_012462 [Adiantum nelumboides]|nr:hypothetical protein [Adiantum nelumboides]
MMIRRLFPKLAKESFFPCTHQFSNCLFRPLQRGLATAAGPPFGNSKQQEPCLQNSIFRANIYASSPVLSRFNADLSKWPSVCTISVKGPCLLSKCGLRIDGKKGWHSQYDWHCQQRYRHSACQSSVACSTEEYAERNSNGCFSSCEPNRDRRNAQQADEACSIDTEEIVCTQSCDGKELDTRVASSVKFRIGRRFRANPQAIQARLKLDLCSKEADLRGALELYDQVKREQQVQFDIYAYNILLYLCSGVASGKLLQDCRHKKRNRKTTVLDDKNADKFSNSPKNSDIPKVWVHFSREDIELAITRGADILEDMLQQGVEPNEATYTSIVRLAVAKNDADLAFETIKLMESSGVPPKLRSYGPLLLSLCECNKADKAYEVDDHMLSLGVQPDESMLDSLLKVSTLARREDKVYSLLHRLRVSVRALLPATVQSVEKWFISEHAAFAGKIMQKSQPSSEELRRAMLACGGGSHNLGWLGTGAWQVNRTSMSKTGSCLSCGERLCVVDLDAKDTDDFANCIAKLACNLNKGYKQFPSFQDWLNKHGPFDAIIDGANVGLYNPKVYGGFNASLLQAVINEASARFCTRKPPLVILHSRHREELAKASNGNSLLNKRKDYVAYFTPLGSNDDWFWLYAAVKCKCMLVSNDQMRDHIFALLGNNFFSKWKERHQVQFSFTSKSLEIHMPPPYSTMIQESQRGSWHVPQALQAEDDDSGGLREWLCATRSCAVS